MHEHAEPLRRIQELCARLTGAVEASFLVRGHAEQLNAAVDALVAATKPERRKEPRVKQYVSTHG